MLDGLGKRSLSVLRAARNKDIAAGIIFVGFGVVFLLMASGYSMGSARRMGPGYFPAVLSGILIVLGFCTVIRGILVSSEQVSGFAFKPLVLITVGTVIFGAIVHAAGLALSVVLLVLIVAYASVHFKWRAATLLGLGMSIFCVVVFVIGLGLPVPIFGWLFRFD